MKKMRLNNCDLTGSSSDTVFWVRRVMPPVGTLSFTLLLVISLNSSE